MVYGRVLYRHVWHVFVVRGYNATTQIIFIDTYFVRGIILHDFLLGPNIFLFIDIQEYAFLC